MSEGRIRILFVDDSPDVLEGIRRMLYGFDRVWDLRYAGGGAEALALVTEAPCDIVVTDLQMPGMDGTALIRRIQALQPATRCVVMCGDAETPEAKAMACQGYPILEKPCDGDQIRSIIGTEVRHLNGPGAITEAKQ